MGEPQLYHERHGEGRPAVVLVHGLCCAGTDWAAQVERLRERHEVMTVDLRGHGRSGGFADGLDVVTSGADVVELARRHALAPAVVVGHSMGCRVAVEAARRAPDLFRGVVLVDGSILAAAPDDARAPVDFGDVREGLFDAMFLESSDASLKRAVVERARAVPVEVGQSFHDSMIAYDAERMEAALAALAVPVVVVQSTYMNPERRRVPVEPGMRVPWIELVERVVPGARAEVVSGVGHFTMLEAPDAVSTVIEEVVQRAGA
jgi:pimeloyl-ACP methyl ester carboxylesterase